MNEIQTSKTRHERVVDVRPRLRIVQLNRCERGQFGLCMSPIDGAVGAKITKVSDHQTSDIRTDDCIMSIQMNDMDTCSPSMLAWDHQDIRRFLELCTTAVIEVRQFYKRVEHFAHADQDYGITMSDDRPYLEIIDVDTDRFPDLKAGDVIVSVNNVPVTTIEEFEDISNNKSCKLLVYRFNEPVEEVEEVEEVQHRAIVEAPGKAPPDPISASLMTDQEFHLFLQAARTNNAQLYRAMASLDTAKLIGGMTARSSERADDVRQLIKSNELSQERGCQVM